MKIDCGPLLLVFQGTHYGSIFGAITFAFGIGGAISSWLGGVFFDRWGHYQHGLAVAMIAFLSTLCSMWVAAPRKVVTRGSLRR